jgi:hypothetical protein
VVINSTISPPLPLRPGVPQGSVLGPILFTVYITGLREIIVKHHFDFALYADDVQMFQSVNPQNLANLVQRAEDCIKELKLWFTSMKLTLNAAKTETILIGMPRALRKCQYPGLVIDGNLVAAKNKVLTSV